VRFELQRGIQNGRRVSRVGLVMRAVRFCQTVRSIERRLMASHESPRHAQTILALTMAATPQMATFLTYLIEGRPYSRSSANFILR
jgi:hypothetical protein